MFFSYFSCTRAGLLWICDLGAGTFRRNIQNSEQWDIWDMFDCEINNSGDVPKLPEFLDY